MRPVRCEGDVMRSPLVRMLADMVEAALAARAAMRYACDHEEEVSRLQDEVLADDNLADVLHTGVQTEGAPSKAEGTARR